MSDPHTTPDDDRRPIRAAGGAGAPRTAQRESGHPTGKAAVLLVVVTLVLVLLAVLSTF